ncbi:DUF4258 domain-containing protein [bacterium]|nr:DUF4258 domain-containing protein [bacterium]
MKVIIHPHARERMIERGATEEEVNKTVEYGESFPAKYGRIGFRHNFSNDFNWRNKKYKNKQIEVIGVQENDEFIVVTLIVKYF